MSGRKGRINKKINSNKLYQNNELNSSFKYQHQPRPITICASLFTDFCIMGYKQQLGTTDLNALQ